MEITINDLKLLYIPIESNYIITYISHILTSNVFALFKEIFTSFFPLYSSGKLEYKNVCGPNADYICKNIKIRDKSFGKIIITDWLKTDNRATISYIESIYGSAPLTIGASYHALSYIEIAVDEKIYYIAIETTNCIFYKLQYYIGESAEELKTILKARYQCKDYKISYDCDKSWMEIAWPHMYKGGSGKKKYKKRSVRKYKKKRTVTSKAK